MPKKAVSLTLDESNLLWLKGRGYGHGNLSAAVDDLITAARAGQLGVPAAPRSVVGTIDLAADDAGLEGADRTYVTCSPRRSRGRFASLKHARRTSRFGASSAHAVVAELPAAVADTHALLFHAATSRALGRRAAAHFDACERQQALAYVPMAVIWEVSLLARASRINLRRPIRNFFDDLSATRRITRST